MKITGIVYNKDSQPEPFAKVFVSDFKGTITPKKIATLTDDKGKFQLDVTNKDDIYLTAKTSLGEQTLTKIKNEVNDYGMYLDSDKTSNLQEVTVTAKRPVKEPVKEPVVESRPNPKVKIDTSKQRKWLRYGLIALAGIVIIGTTIYAIRKNK